MGQISKLIKKYSSVIRFTLTFFSVYLVLSVIYKIYLDNSDSEAYYPDYITNLVARQSKAVFNALDYRADIVNSEGEPTLKLILNDKYVARVVEGCNSVSVIILFISFVIAFADRIKSTFLFILAGSALLYAVNLFRIVFLSIGLYYYPWRRDLLHTVIFPMIIYGMVFLLWMIWINHFATTKRR